MGITNYFSMRLRNFNLGLFRQGIETKSLPLPQAGPKRVEICVAGLAVDSPVARLAPCRQKIIL
jgi:hypothetical protein